MRRLLSVVATLVFLSVSMPLASAQESTPVASPQSSAASPIPIVASPSTSVATPIASDLDTTTERAAGDAMDLVPNVNPDTVSVVMGSATDRGTVLVVVRNSTSGAAQSVEVQVTVRTADGQLFAVGKAPIYPQLIVSGGVGFGEIQLDAQVPQGATFDFEVESWGFDPYNLRGDLIVLSHSKIENRIVGEVINVGVDPAPYSAVHVLCFVDNNLSSMQFDTVPDDRIESGETAVFQATLYSSCDKYILAVD